MTNLHTIRTACHVAVLDPMQGYGALVLPEPGTDVPDPLGGLSLHAADWNVMVRALRELEYEPDQDEDGDLLREEDAGEIEVVALVGDALSSEWDPKTFEAARREVLAQALAA